VWCLYLLKNGFVGLFVILMLKGAALHPIYFSFLLLHYMRSLYPFLPPSSLSLFLSPISLPFYVPLPLTSSLSIPPHLSIPSIS
jgi:hypothetical protein